MLGLRERFPGIAFGWEHELRFGSEPAYEALRESDWWPRPQGSYPPCDPLEWTLPLTKLLARLPAAADEITASDENDGVALVPERLATRAGASRSARSRP